jgi:Bacterial PH domain
VRSPQPDREVFRLAPPVIFWWVWVAFAAANVADFAIQGAQARFATVVSAILVTVTGLAYALALRPRVIAEPSGLTIVNPFRDHHVPWAAIQAVDTGEWVRVHYAASAAAPGAAAGPPSISSASSKAISCWALYISAGAKRKAARAAPAAAPGFAQPASRPRSRRTPTLSGRFASTADWLATTNQQARSAGNSRLPEEAKYLASLPAAKAIAVRLDARADRERARLAQPVPAQPGATQPSPAHPGATQPSPAQASATQAGSAQASAAQANATQPGPAQATTQSPVTSRWAWPPLAAVAVPLLALLIILIA